MHPDPNTMKEHPGAGDVYAKPNTRKEKHKPEEHPPTYQVLFLIYCHHSKYNFNSGFCWIRFKFLR